MVSDSDGVLLRLLASQIVFKHLKVVEALTTEAGFAFMEGLSSASITTSSHWDRSDHSAQICGRFLLTE
jgi:hypothetical protein